MAKSPKEKRRLLESVGIDPYPGVESLSRDQRNYIARLWRKYHEVVEAPKGEFEAIRTKRNDVVRRARETGYRTFRDRVFIPLEGYKSAKITKAGHISRRFDETKSSIEYLVPKRDLPELAERLKKRGLKDYEQITAKFGSGAAFKTVYQNLGDLEQYLKVFTPRAFREAFAELDKMRRQGMSKRQFELERAKVQRRADKEKTELLRSLSIVKIRDDDFVVDPEARKPRTNENRRKASSRRRNRR